MKNKQANPMRVTLEVGPKHKKVVAVAPDWPGLARGATTETAAIERLRAYLPRYAKVATLAQLDAEFADETAAMTDVEHEIEIVERYPGTGSTDFWGISFAFSSIDQQAVPVDVLERDLKLMRACWTFFDDVRSRVSAEMQKGPRGGGRDRDHIIRHVLVNEQDWAKGVGVTIAENASLTAEGLNAYREAYCDAIRTCHAQNKMAKKWPL